MAKKNTNKVSDSALKHKRVCSDEDMGNQTSLWIDTQGGVSVSHAPAPSVPLTAAKSTAPAPPVPPPDVDNDASLDGGPAADTDDDQHGNIGDQIPTKFASGAFLAEGFRAKDKATNSQLFLINSTHKASAGQMVFGASPDTEFVSFRVAALWLTTRVDLQSTLESPAEMLFRRIHEVRNVLNTRFHDKKHPINFRFAPWRLEYPIVLLVFGEDNAAPLSVSDMASAVSLARDLARSMHVSLESCRLAFDVKTRWQLDSNWLRSRTNTVPKVHTNVSIVCFPLKHLGAVPWSGDEKRVIEKELEVEKDSDNESMGFTLERSNRPDWAKRGKKPGAYFGYGPIHYYMHFPDASPPLAEDIVVAMLQITLELDYLPFESTQSDKAALIIVPVWRTRPDGTPLEDHRVNVTAFLAQLPPLPDDRQRRIIYLVCRECAMPEGLDTISISGPLQAQTKLTGKGNVNRVNMYYLRPTFNHKTPALTLLPQPYENKRRPHLDFTDVSHTTLRQKALFKARESVLREYTTDMPIDKRRYVYVVD